MLHTRKLGELGERIAGTFLEIKGYEIVARNFRYAGREIDLIAKRGRLLVAVEVKLRRTDRFGLASEAIDSRKLGRIRIALQGFISITRQSLVPRIDAVVIDLMETEGVMRITHLEGIS